MALTALIVSVFATLVAVGQWIAAHLGLRQQRLQNLFQLGMELQADDQRKSRALLYELQQSGRDLDSWTVEERAAAEDVAQLFNLAAWFDLHGMLPPGALREVWGPAIRRIFVAAKPLIDARRAKEQIRLWPQLEEFAEELEVAP